MKTAVIIFHKNIKKLYKQSWIDTCVKSVLEQSYNDFNIFEINYGNEDYSVFEGHDIKLRKHYFFKKLYPTHIEAMTFLLNKCFISENYDIVFNTNLDDYYHKERFAEQVKCLKSGFDLCSTLWSYFKEEDGEEKITLEFTLRKLGLKGNIYADSNLVKKQLNKKNNVINHSGVAYTRKFWVDKDKNGIKNKYREDKPFEDLTLWTRSANSGSKLTVINKDLIKYRLHENQIGNANKTGNKNKEMDGGFSEPDYSDIRYGVFILVDNKNKNKLNNFMKETFRSDIKKHMKKTLFIITNTNLEGLIPSVKYNYLVGKVENNEIFEKIKNSTFPEENFIKYKKLFDVRIGILCDKIIWDYFYSL